MGRILTERRMNVATILGALSFALLLCAMLYPDKLWGIHYIAFLSKPISYSIFGCFVAIFLTSLFFPLGKYSDESFIAKRVQYIVVFLFAIIAIFAYYNFPINANVYGDTELFSRMIGFSTDQLIPLYAENLFSLDVSSPKTGNLTVISGVRLLSYYFSISHQEAYQLLGAVCGFLYVVVWGVFIINYFEKNTTKIALFTIGILAPYTQIFFGYQEIYAPSVLTFTMYLCFLVYYFHSRNKSHLVLLTVLYFLCLKSHSSAFLLMPTYVIALGSSFIRDGVNRIVLRSWKTALQFIMLPILILGGVVYFFVLEAHVEPRFLGEEVDIYTRLFLPITQDLPPLNRYALFHWNHLLDYVNLTFIWSLSSIILLCYYLVNFKQINWNQPILILTGLNTMIFVLFFFAVNPLMSMPYDWDYFSLPGITLVVFVSVVSKEFEQTSKVSIPVGLVLSVSLFVIPRFVVNYNSKFLSNRLENLGKYVFKTYWIRSAGDISAGIYLDNTVNPISRFENAVKELESFAVQGNDIEYANLLWRTGQELRKAKDYDSALGYHVLASQYDKELTANYIGLMECNFMLENYQAAADYAQTLVQLQYPSYQKALLIGVQCAIFSEDYEAAKRYSDAYLEKWSSDKITYIRTRLSQGEDLEQLKHQF